MAKPVILSREEFAARDYPPVEFVLSPWLPTSGVALISGYPAAGKTFFGLAAASAIATGSSVLGFSAPSPRKVLYVDGEMDPAETRDRLKAIERGMGVTANNLSILQHADQPDGIPDLSTLKGQAWMNDIIDHDVVFFDNIGALFRSGDEKEQTSWKAPGEWILRMRAAGISVVLFHHTGKPQKDDINGGVTYAQHGTSARERVPNIDAILAPHRKEEGVFTIKWGKWRGTGGARKPKPETWRIDWPSPSAPCLFVPHTSAPDVDTADKPRRTLGGASKFVKGAK